MSLNIDLKQYCTKAVTDEGFRLYKAQGILELSSAPTAEGALLLKGKCVDSFNFVDRPWLLVDSEGMQLQDFGCDCPQWRLERSFCAHCAALVFGQQEHPVADGSLLASEREDDGECIVSIKEQSGPGVMDLSYKFCNSSYDLYPFERSPRIPLERFIQVYGDNARARALFNNVRSWGGSCFGFISSASMLYQPDSDMELLDFNPDAQLPSQLELTDRSGKLGMTLHSLIEALQIMQHGNYVWRYGTLDQLAAGTEAFQNGKGEPVGMAIYSAPGSHDGHAILPFRLERTDGAEDILHIYDPNRPLKTRFGYLEKNEAGSYINWRFAMSNKTYGSKTGGELYLGFYKIYKEAWDRRGGDAKNLLYLKPGMAVLDAAGTLLARATQNGVETFCDDMHPIRVAGCGPDEDLSLSVPAGAFRVTLEDPELEELKVQLLGIDLTVDLATTAREAEISVDDETKTVFARIVASEAKYSVEILNTLGVAEENTVLTGMTGQQALHLIQQDSRLYASGLTEQAALCINSASTPLTVIGKLVEEEEMIANCPPEKPEDTQV